jgi:hypothetical protein
MTAGVSVHARFDAKFVVQPGGCWEWTAGIQSSGYGAFWPERTQMVLAHRYAWERTRGPIPAGLWIDHLCRNRRCVNVDHLELVTPAENTRRGTALTTSAAKAKARAHCKNGHPWTGINVAQRADHPGRRCRSCAVESAARYRARKAAAA